MALTITKGRNTINVVFDGATAWDSTTDYPDGLSVESLEFKPAATDNVMTVREGSATGVRYFSAKAATAYDNKVKYFPTAQSDKKLSLYVVGNEATTGGMLIVQCK